jgi:hypothetical protein
MSDTTDPRPDDAASPKAHDHAGLASDPFARTEANDAPATSGSANSSRRGIGLFTATAMSTLAAVGGAYLALFIQARPDLMVSAGLSRVLPQPAADAAINPALASRLSTLETDLAALEARVARLGAATPPTTAPTTGGPGLAGPATPGGASGPATTPVTPPTGPAAATPANPQAGAPPATAPLQAPPAAIVAAAPTATELAALGGRVTAIETRLAALDPTGAGGAVIAGLQTEIATLKVLVARLQGQVDSAPPAGVTLAVVALAEAASRNGPFLQEFETVRAALPGVPEAASLADLARTGAPSRALLAERFTGLAPAIAALEAQSRDEGGLTGWFRSIIASLIRVEEPATTEGAGSTALLTRAKLKLDQGDLAGAIAEVGEISPQPDAVRAWLSGAKARLELERKLAALRGAVEGGAYARTEAPVNPAQAPAAAGAPQVGVIPAAPQRDAPQLPAQPPSSPAPATKETTP